MINLRFFGTGGIGSARPKNKLSKDYRRFSTLLIDEKIIIDPSEDIFEFVESFMLSGILDEVKDVFITHSHPDHFSLSAIEGLAKKCSLRVYASEALETEISGVRNVEYVKLIPFGLVKIGKYSILPLPSNHKTDIPNETPLNFIIECDDKTLLYALDGAFIDADAWQVLKEVKLDVAVLDFGAGISDYSSACVLHNNIQTVTAMREIFISSGVASESTKFILSHIPSGKKSPTHEEITSTIADTPFKLAYDGYFLGV